MLVHVVVVLFAAVVGVGVGVDLVAVVGAAGAAVVGAAVAAVVAVSTPSWCPRCLTNAHSFVVVVVV